MGAPSTLKSVVQSGHVPDWKHFQPFDLFVLCFCWESSKRYEFFSLLKLIYRLGCFLYSLQLNHNFLVAHVSLASGPVPYGCCGMQRDVNTEQKSAACTWYWGILAPLHTPLPLISDIFQRRTAVC